MNGAESLVHTMVANGIDTCFANPGTSEMHFVAALDRIAGIRCIPGMQENVVTGMADGYYRIARKPAATLLHCGPGLANGLANLHNARRAHSGIVNIVGDHATYHSQYEPPLAADTAGFARAVSNWVRTSTRAENVGRDASVAVQAAKTGPGQIATLILPADTAWTQGGIVGEVLPVPDAEHVDRHAIIEVAKTLRNHKNVLLLLGGNGLTVPSQIQVARIQEKHGCKVMTECFNALHPRGQGRLPISRVPYPPVPAIAALAEVEHLVLVGSKPPVGFFAYPGLPSMHHPERANVQVLTRLEQDAASALKALADELSCQPVSTIKSGERPGVPTGAPTSAGFSQMLAAVMPDDAIIAEEGISFAAAFYELSHNAPPHDWLNLTGGAIGYGLPAATGAAVAGKGRRVICPQADGSGMYTLQALWTQAREKLPVTTIILANRKYQILLAEYANVGATPGQTAMDMLDLGRPDLDWVKLANGMGVEAARATTLEECAELMKASFTRAGPFVIELVI